MAYILANTAASRLLGTVERFMSADGFDWIGFLEEHFSTFPPEPLCYVVPTGRRVRWLVREISRRVFERTERPLVGFQPFNLAKLAASLHARLYPDDTALPLSDSLRMALFERAIEQLADDGRLPFYAPNGKPSWSIIERLASVVTGLREDGITPNDLRRDLEQSDDPLALDRHRLADVLAIYERYIELLGDRYRDETALLERTADALLAGSEITHPPIIIEGFSEFRLTELRMLGALAVARVPVCIVLAYSPVNGPLFGNLDETFERLVQLGYTARSFDPASDDGTPIWHRPRTAYLRRWLFNTEQEIRNAEFNDQLTILGCTNRLEEVTLIAKYVKHCILEHRIEPHRICVAMRDPEQYAGLFRELFAVHGIPANISDRFRLDRSPVTVAVMSVLELIVRGWRREDVHRTLSNPLIRCMRPDGSPLDAATINAVAERQRISGGHAQGGARGWIERLRRGLEYAQNYLELLRSQPYTDPLDLREAEQDVEQLKRALGDIEHLIRVLPSHERRMTTSEFCAFVRDGVLDRFGIAASVEEAAELSWKLDKRTLDDIALAEVLEQQTRAYAALLDVLTKIEYAWNDHSARPLQEHVELLATMLRAERYQIAEKPSYGVTVTSIEQTRGIPYDVYVLCGIVDGEFPRAYSTEHFLGKELPQSEERHIRAERIQFYEALTNNPAALERGSWRMLITYPRLTTSGEQLVRSSFVDKLLKITTLAERCFLSHELAAQASQHDGLPPEFSWMLTITSPEERQRIEPAESDRQWEPIADVQLDREALQRIAPLTVHPYSAAELEQYARCPYQYFAQRILQLRQPTTYDLALGNLESGALFHRILYRFYRTLLDREGMPDASGLRTVRLQPSRRDEYWSLLLDCARSELERLRHSHPLFALECELILGTDERRGMLAEWLDRELERFDQGWEYEPALLETAFGMPSKTPDALEEPIALTPTLSIRGKIDRIEIARRGQRLHVVVADYKLISPGSNNTAISGGTAFQMPFYMLAARSILQKRYGVDPVLDGGVYYILRPKDRDAIPVAMPVSANGLANQFSRHRAKVLDSREQLDELLRTSIEHAERIVAAIGSGAFPVAPTSNQVCEQCAFDSVCRIRQLHDEGLLDTSTSSDDSDQ